MNDAPEHNNIPAGFRSSPQREGFDQTVGPLFFKPNENGGGISAFRVAAPHVNGRDDCHGGMLAGFADVAWHQSLPNLHYSGWATVAMKTYFVAPAPLGAWVEGASFLVSQRDDLFTVEGRIWIGDATILTGSAIYKGVRRRT